MIPRSIRLRILLLAALSALGAGGVAGFASWRVVGRGVEERLVHGLVRNAAGMTAQLSLPLSDKLLEQMSSLVGGELIAVDRRGGLLATSLPRPEATRLLHGWRTNSFPRRAVLNGDSQAVGSARIGAQADNARLILLVPAERVRRAKRQVALHVSGATAAAILAAMAVALFSARSVTAPLQELTADMVRISQFGLDAGGQAGQNRPIRTSDSRGGPSEVASLRHSFDTLLKSLAEAQASLEQTAQLAALGKVAVSVVHELRNPLSAIRMNVRILADELGQTALDGQGLDVIEREIDRMDLYLEELVSLRPDAADARQPAFRSRHGVVNLPDVVSSVVALLDARCRHAGIRIRAEEDSPLPAIVGDSSRLRQVVMNLALNAMDAMPGGGDLTIRSAAAADGQFAECRVLDTGPGLDAESLQRAFEVFVTTKPHGAGLGLYISRRIVQQHDGTIEARNREDGGAEFIVRLPAAPSERDHA